MIRATIFTDSGYFSKVFQSLDEAQNYIDGTVGVIGYRAFQVSGKKTKKELNNGTR